MKSNHRYSRSISSTPFYTYVWFIQARSESGILTIAQSIIHMPVTRAFRILELLCMHGWHWCANFVYVVRSNCSRLESETHRLSWTKIRLSLRTYPTPHYNWHTIGCRYSLTVLWLPWHIRLAIVGNTEPKQLVVKSWSPVTYNANFLTHAIAMAGGMRSTTASNDCPITISAALSRRS